MQFFLLLGAFALLLLLGFPLLFLSGEKQGRVAFDEPIELPFAIEPHKRVALLYLGYVGCQSICMPSLQESAQMFAELNASSVAFYFVNISKEGVGAKEFASFFHQDFIGVQPLPKERAALMQSLRAYSSDALTLGGDIYHTGYLYLISNKKGQARLKAMYYTRPFDAASIISDIKKELQ